ncbi:MAG: hypothetical protein ACP5DQ_02835 [Bacteroidales bacterium]
MLFQKMIISLPVMFIMIELGDMWINCDKIYGKILEKKDYPRNFPFHDACWLFI